MIWGRGKLIYLHIFSAVIHIPTTREESNICMEISFSMYIYLKIWPELPTFYTFGESKLFTFLFSLEDKIGEGFLFFDRQQQGSTIGFGNTTYPLYYIMSYRKQGRFRRVEISSHNLFTQHTYNRQTITIDDILHRIEEAIFAAELILLPPSFGERWLQVCFCNYQSPPPRIYQALLCR